MNTHSFASDPDVDRLFTVPEAAALLSVGRSVLYELMNEGKIRSVKVGRSRRIPRSALQEFLASLPAVSRYKQQRPWHTDDEDLPTGLRPPYASGHR